MMVRISWQVGDDEEDREHKDFANDDHDALLKFISSRRGLPGVSHVHAETLDPALEQAEKPQS